MLMKTSPEYLIVLFMSGARFCMSLSILYIHWWLRQQHIKYLKINSLYYDLYSCFSPFGSAPSFLPQYDSAVTGLDFEKLQIFDALLLSATSIGDVNEVMHHRVPDMKSALSQSLSLD